MSSSFRPSKIFFSGLFLVVARDGSMVTESEGVVVCVVMCGDVSEDCGRTGFVRDCEIVVDG